MKNDKTIPKIPIQNSLPIIIIVFQIAIIPLVVYLNILPIHSENVSVWNSDGNWDFFSYYKSVLIIITAAILLILLSMELFIKGYKIKISSLMIAGTAYTLFAILSAISSPFPHTSLFGFPDRYEGLLVVLSYMIILMAVHHYVESQKQITLILKALLISATVVATIGILQFFGMDLFKSAFGQNLIIPEHYANLLNLISFQTDERLTNASAIYSTMLNPNTYGLYLATIFPLCLSLFLQTERISKKIALGFISCLLFGNLIGSFSRGAYIGAIISILITGMLFGQKFKMKWKRAIIILIPFVLIYLGMNFYSSGTISSKVQTLVNTTENHAEDTIIDKVKNFSIDQNSLTIHCSKTLLNLSIVDGSLKFYDDNQNILLLKTMDGKGEYEIADKKYINYELTIIDNLIKVKKGKSFLYFAIEDNEFSFLDSKGVAQKNTNIQRIGFKGLERLGSGRGYIWSRTIPILKGTIFVGTGPDTYAMAFPQNDFIGKLNYMYDANIIIDKPHNMYLQTAVNTGVLSLLSLLTIFTIYIVQFIARFKKSSQVNFYSKIGLAIFPAMLAYMLSAMFTDSTVSVAPVFWILLATGFVINKHMNI